MADKKTEPIDRERLKTPESVSGWHSMGEGKPQQDFSDIARKDAKRNPEVGSDRSKGGASPEAQEKGRK